MKHTKGPWAVDIRSTDLGIYGFVGPASNRETIARVECPNSEGEANARLIAAAPALLEALIGMREMYQYANNRAAFAGMGGDRYINPGRMDRVLCEIFGLDYMSASESELQKAIDTIRGAK